MAALILCGAHNADRVMVAGKWLLLDGVPIKLDILRLRQDHESAAKRFVSSYLDVRI